MNDLRRALVIGALALVTTACGSPPEAPRREVGFAPVNGTRLYYEMAGRGDPVIFIHGFTLDTRMWDDQFTEFSRRYRAIRYDARGFGKSAGISGPFSIREDLRALMDHLGVKEAHLIGFSAGGRYAIDFTIDYPERVKSLVAVDAVLGGFPMPNYGREFARAIEAGKSGNVAEAKRIWLALDLFKPAAEQSAVARRLKQMVDDYSGWHFVNGPGAQEQPLNPPAATRLAEIRKPTLVVVGSREIPELLAAADKMFKEIPNAKRAIIPNVGHMSNMESPGVFNSTVFQFLTTVK